MPSLVCGYIAQIACEALTPQPPCTRALLLQDMAVVSVALRAALGVSGDDLPIAQTEAEVLKFLDDPSGMYNYWHGGDTPFDAAD